MHLNNRTIISIGFSSKARWLAYGIVLAVFSLLVAACGDNTATAVPPTVAATAASATTAAMTTSAATTAAITTNAAVTTSTATTAVVTTVSVTTASASGSTSVATGQPKIVLGDTTVQAGTTVPVTGDGFPPNTWLTLQFGPGTTTRSVASLALTDGSGKFNSQIIFSAYGDGSKLVPGGNTLKGITEDGAITASTTFTIVPAPATATPKA